MLTTINDAMAGQLATAACCQEGTRPAGRETPGNRGRTNRSTAMIIVAHGAVMARKTGTAYQAFAIL
jgi:hypothetical protein